MLVGKLFLWHNLLFGNTFLQLNTKLLKVKINDRKMEITFVTTILHVKFCKDVLTAVIPSEFGKLTKLLRPGILNISCPVFFVLCWCSVKSHLYLVYKMAFVELLAEGVIFILRNIWCVTINKTNHWPSRITLFMYFRLNIKSSCLSVYLSIYLLICLSIHLPIYLSISLSIYIHMHAYKLCIHLF